MSNRTIIPFGPQHPVLPEPIHLDLVVEDERVIEAIPSFGFIHRGLERLVEKKDFQEFTFVAERVCGICSFIHGMGYCQAVERVMGITLPPRADYLRTFWAELSRIHSHLLWMGLVADAFGFENLFMNSWRIRENILDIVEETTGGRVIFGAAKIGGTRRDVTNDKLKEIGRTLKTIEAELHAITDVFEQDYSVQQRLRGIGILSREDAFDLGAVGPTLRGSGEPMDARCEGYAAYRDIEVEPIVESDCDSYARCMVRIREIYQSFDIIRQVLCRMPDGETEIKVKGYPNGEHFARLEQPRGEVLYYVKGNGTKHLDRFRVRTPTFANIPPLLKMLQGCDLPDVPVIVLTIDPCISCAER
ncbi:MAG: nickel-dependent hydrogenase large subunit [Verrucomicrobia bacterium]|nr:nickel-dependent hydrogenase large subunit [Kiritimatiellia bacterium]MCP5487075.1 nickel-dependent hydrogenase large subunit [Verrucomicrobiota bacterium]